MHKEACLAANKRWSAAHREQHSALISAWKKRNPEKERDRAKRWWAKKKIRLGIPDVHHSTPEELLANRKVYEKRKYEHHHEKIKARARTWYANLAPEKKEAYKRRIHIWTMTTSKGRAGLAAYRARRRGAVVEPVDVEVLFARDGGICQICGDRCDRKLASIDHIFPLVRGGKHSYANTQLAHRGCNSRKSDKTMEEYYAVYSHPRKRCPAGIVG